LEENVFKTFQKIDLICNLLKVLLATETKSKQYINTPFRKRILSRLQELTCDIAKTLCHWTVIRMSYSHCFSS